MKEILFDSNNIRMEISFKSFDELRKTLSFYQRNDLYKINIPCKNSLKKDFLLESIKLARKEFPNIDIIPHFSILHEFRRNSFNTQGALINFLEIVSYLGCKEVLLVSGSQKRSTLDSVSSLSFLKDNPTFCSSDISIGVAFNPFLPSFLFEEEIKRLEKKLKSGLVSSVWMQFGTDCELLKSRIKILKNSIDYAMKNNLNQSNITIFGSILIPSKQFLARFKYRPWKGVYCSNEFLDSLEFANKIIKELLINYKNNKIFPIIETPVYNDENLKILKNHFLS